MRGVVVGGAAASRASSSPELSVNRGNKKAVVFRKSARISFLTVGAVVISVDGAGGSGEDGVGVSGKKGVVSERVMVSHNPHANRVLRDPLLPAIN